MAARGRAKKKAAKKPARTEILVDWKELRTEWEENPSASFRNLARPGASRQTIARRAEDEGWTRVDGAKPEIQQAVADKADAKSADIRPVEGEVLDAEPPPDPPGVPAPRSIDSAIEARAAIIDRHRREWNLARNRLYQGLQQSKFDKLKEAKIAAETLSIIQSNERKTWGLDGTPTINVRVLPPSRRDDND